MLFFLRVINRTNTIILEQKEEGFESNGIITIFSNIRLGIRSRFHFFLPLLLLAFFG